MPVRYRLCVGCDQPIKPGRHKKDEYQHASGCPRDRSKRRERPIEVISDGSLRNLTAAEIRKWRKKMRGLLHLERAEKG